MATTMTRRIRSTAASLAILGVLAVVSPVTANAGIAAMIVNPTSLKAGETIGASGNCSYEHVDVLLTEGTEGPYDDPTGAEISSAYASVDAENQWAADVVVPAGTAPGAYTLSARCAGEQGNYSYGNVAITVLASAATTSTTTTVAPTTTVAKTTTTVAATATKPAVAVAGTPKYTG